MINEKTTIKCGFFVIKFLCYNSKMTRKNTLIIIIIIILLIAGYYLLKGMGNWGLDEKTRKELSNTGLFRDMLGINHSAECNVTGNVNGNNISGIAYVKPSFFRADYSLANDQKNIYRIIRTGEKIYSWYNNSAYFAELSNIANTKTILVQSDTDKIDFARNLDQILTYNCTQTSVADSRFIPPQEINFGNIVDIANNQEPRSATSTIPVNSTLTPATTTTNKPTSPGDTSATTTNINNTNSTTTP